MRARNGLVIEPMLFNAWHLIDQTETSRSDTILGILTLHKTNSRMVSILTLNRILDKNLLA